VKAREKFFKRKENNHMFDRINDAMAEAREARKELEKAEEKISKIDAEIRRIRLEEADKLFSDFCNKFKEAYEARMKVTNFLSENFDLELVIMTDEPQIDDINSKIYGLNEEGIKEIIKKGVFLI